MLCDCVTRGCGDHSPLTTAAILEFLVNYIVLVNSSVLVNLFFESKDPLAGFRV